MVNGTGKRANLPFSNVLRYVVCCPFDFISWNRLWYRYQAKIVSYVNAGDEVVVVVDLKP